MGEQALQEVAALFERPAPQVLAVEPQEIERHQHGVAVVPPLEELEARRPLPVEGDDLAVDHGVAHDQAAEGGGDAAEPPARSSRLRDQTATRPADTADSARKPSYFSS